MPGSFTPPYPHPLVRPVTSIFLLLPLLNVRDAVADRETGLCRK
jgi:hypothetical protein